MIVIAGNNGSVDTSSWTALERDIYSQKKDSASIYSYDSLEELQFELALRARIVNAARALWSSKVDFASFQRSRCNWKYWIRTEKGGFQLRPNVSPSEAINDIFLNGGLYAFECATAMVIVLYKAMLDMIGEERFNALYDNLLLWDWNYDSDLHLITLNTNDESYAGDILYFRNPDVSPETPEWQGENVVKLANNLYYGHGIGNKSEQQMIAELNGHRRPNSQQSAYLKNQATYPDYKFLFHQFNTGAGRLHYRFLPQLLNYRAKAAIGASNYLRL